MNTINDDDVVKLDPVTREHRIQQLKREIAAISRIYAKKIGKGNDHGIDHKRDDLH